MFVLHTKRRNFATVRCLFHRDWNPWETFRLPLWTAPAPQNNSEFQSLRIVFCEFQIFAHSLRYVRTYTRIKKKRRQRSCCQLTKSQIHSEHKSQNPCTSYMYFSFDIAIVTRFCSSSFLVSTESSNLQHILVKQWVVVVVSVVVVVGSHVKEPSSQQQLSFSYILQKTVDNTQNIAQWRMLHGDNSLEILKDVCYHYFSNNSCLFTIVVTMGTNETCLVTRMTFIFPLLPQLLLLAAICFKLSGGGQEERRERDMKNNLRNVFSSFSTKDASVLSLMSESVWKFLSSPKLDGKICLFWRSF